MDLVCRKLQIKPGERVIEAGCGWGSLALFMARRYGVTVRGVNISAEQIAYARNRVNDEGLADRVEFVEDDYRNVRGTYDVFVSVGMLEHVGLPDYPTLGSVIGRSLTERGHSLAPERRDAGDRRLCTKTQAIQQPLSRRSRPCMTQAIGVAANHAPGRQITDVL